MTISNEPSLTESQEAALSASIAELVNEFQPRSPGVVEQRMSSIARFCARQNVAPERIRRAAHLLCDTNDHFPKTKEYISAIKTVGVEQRSAERTRLPDDQAALIARLNDHIELKLGRDCMHRINVRWEREEPGEVWLRVHDLHRVRNWFAQFNSMEAWWNANDPFKRRLRLIDDNDVWDDFTPTLGRLQLGDAA